MSTRRSGRYIKKQLVIDGCKMCIWCDGPMPRTCRTFCSGPCEENHMVRVNPSWARRRVWERDKGVCAVCRVNAMVGHPGWGPDGHLWQADHIISVVEGGGECGLENYRTLCTACHKAETAALRVRMALKRKYGDTLAEQGGLFNCG